MRARVNARGSVQLLSFSGIPAFVVGWGVWGDEGGNGFLCPHLSPFHTSIQHLCKGERSPFSVCASHNYTGCKVFFTFKIKALAYCSHTDSFYSTIP